jgi:hypothetical protein
MNSLTRQYDVKQYFEYTSHKKIYNNCKVKIKIGKKYTEIDYTTGVHQGNNMSSVLFLYVIHAFTETLHLEARPTQCAFFPENKNGNLSTCKGRLLSHCTTAKENPSTLIHPSILMTVFSFFKPAKNSTKPSSN